VRVRAHGYLLKAGKDECSYEPCISTKSDYLMNLLSDLSSNVRAYRYWADLLYCSSSYCVLPGKLVWF